MDKPTKHIWLGIFGYLLAIALYGVAITGDMSGVYWAIFILFSATMGTIFIWLFAFLKPYCLACLMAAIVLVFYGVKYKEHWLGQVTVVLGFIIWTIIGPRAFAE